MTSAPMRIIAACLLAGLAAACSGGPPRATLDQATQLADRLTTEVPVGPDSREELEGMDGPIYHLSPTIMLRWEDFPAADDPIEVLAAALRRSGMVVVERAATYPEGRPNSGERDIPELVACVPTADPHVGASISIGQVDETTVAVAAHIGGTPAATRCGRSRG